jgi:hypothetical protein
MWTVFKVDFGWSKRNRIFNPALTEERLKESYTKYKAQYQNIATKNIKQEEQKTTKELTISHPTHSLLQNNVSR